MFIAGIDGGGTHTRLEIRDMENNLLRREVFGPFNINSIGEEAFRTLLAQVFASCGSMADCTSLCVGAAGISNLKVGQILREELDKAGFRGAYQLCGDQAIALRGAIDGPGVAVIAGTGSICFGKNSAGQTARSGGYGHLIDDGGSGYALGRDVLSYAVRTVDGRGDHKAILEAVYRKLNASRPEEIVSFVYGPATDKAAIAKFSAIALDLAAQGDPDAREILTRNAAELHAIVEAAQKQLDLRDCPIALLGGLLSGENPYHSIVVEALSPLGTVLAPGHDALWGAAQMSWELLNLQN